MGSHKSRLPALAVFGVVALLLTAWVIHYGPVWPRKDSFFYLVYMQKIQEGSLSFGQFLALRNNEHLVVVQYALALVSLKFFGLNFRPMLFENLIYLLIFGVLTFVSISRSAVARRYTVLTPLIVAVPMLNPSQASYLLWEFQTWFYYTLALFAAQIVLIENFRFRAYPIILLMCLIATGSEAQGSFLWLTSGAHLFWLAMCDREQKARKRGGLVLVIHVFIFLGLSWLMMHSHYMDAATDSIVHGVAKPNIKSRILYFTTLLGGGFGSRDVVIALALGSCSLVTWLVFVALSAVQRFDTVEVRVAFLLTGISLLWNLAFTVARENLGIPWAFSEFHASPMLIPFFIGIGIFALHAATSHVSKAWKFAPCIGILAAIAPIVTGATTAHKISAGIRINAMLAAALECNHTDNSRYLKMRLEGLEGAEDRYASIAHFRREMCASQPGTSSWVPMLKPPPSFTLLAASDPHTKAAMAALWDVYLSHNDLREAFGIFDPNLGDKLLDFAAWDARQGSRYEPGMLSPFADVYERVIPTGR